jgi:hypothetical protein
MSDERVEESDPRAGPVAPSPDDVDGSPPSGGTSASIPRVGEAIGGAFDLAIGGSRQVRAVSVYCGILILAFAGPAIVLFLAVARDLGLDETVRLIADPQSSFGAPELPEVGMIRLALVVAVFGSFAVLIEGQILVAAVLGAVATGRRLVLRDALRLSRRVFWPVLGTAILVGLTGLAAELLVELILQPRTVAALETSLIAQIIASVVATAPFAFWMAGIVIGGVGPIESLKRSVRIASSRWRLALLVASAGSVLSIIQLFAFSAGFDLLARLAQALGLDVEGAPTNALLTGAITVAGVVAASSLLVTIAALVAAPQIYVFIRMTGYSAGLDRAVTGAHPSAAPTRIVTRPMLALIGFGVFIAVLGLTAL